jgi:hypothetical protein
MSVELAELKTRKQALLIQSDLHRQTLLIDAAALEASMTWVDQGVSLFRQARPVLLACGPVLGFLLARRTGRKISFAPTALSLWQLGRTLADFWKSLRKPYERASAGRKTS